MKIEPIKYSHPDFDAIFDKDQFFDQVKHEYPILKRQGIFLDEKQPALFVYKIKTKQRTHYGILAGVDLKEYLKGNIKKHENTLVAQEANISGLLKQREAIIKPVLLAYPEVKKIKNLIIKYFLGVKPTYQIHFKKDDQIHEFYQIKNEDEIKEFQKEFKQGVKKSYIADGHHRMASISELLASTEIKEKHKIKYLFCALFDFKELSIYSFNRLLKLDQFSSGDVIKKLMDLGSLKLLKQAKKPSKKFELIFYIDQMYYSFEWKKELINSYKKKNEILFDITLFNEELLNKAFHIQDVRNNSQIQHIEGTKSWKQILKTIGEENGIIGVMFYPIKSSDFIKIADGGKILPPKSTWFEPRIRNGILVQEIKALKEKKKKL